MRAVRSPAIRLGLLVALLTSGVEVRPAAAAVPAAKRAVLANGLIVLVVPAPRAPRIALRLQILAGSAADPPGKEGVAALTAALLTRGAGPRDSAQVAALLAPSRGTCSSSIDRERAILALEVGPKDLATGLTLLRDAVAHPGLSPATFENVRGETHEAIARASADPAALAERALPAFLMGRHPLGHPAIGWAATVDSMTREDVVAFHARTYLPGRATLVVVGDLDPRATISAITAAFREWTGPPPPLTPAYPPVAIDRRRKVQLVSLSDSTRSEVRFTCPSVARRHPDQFAIQMANAIVGGGPASRLARALGGTPGLADRVASEFRSERDAGQYEIALSTRTGDLRRAIDSTLAVLRKLRDEGPTEDELAAARLALTIAIPPDPQTPAAIAAQVLDLAFFGPPAVDAATTADRLRRVTLDDCRRALKSYCCVDDLAILVVADPDAGRAALEGLGPLTVQEPR